MAKTIEVYPENPQDEWHEKGDCQLCGERYDVMSGLDSFVAGEWWVKDDPRFADEVGQSIIAHPDCAQNLGLEMA